MKKILMIIGIVVAVYLLAVIVLNATARCPKYINLMPGIIGDKVEKIKGPNDPNWWNSLFCPFAEKSY